MMIREYRPSDNRETAELFYNTVHKVNAKDYTKEQLNAWTAGAADLDKWGRSFEGHFCLAAVMGNVIVGFGDIDKTGYLDRLYVHAEHQGEGIASAICDRLEAAVSGDIVTHSSVMARGFFEKRGYCRRAGIECEFDMVCSGFIVAAAAVYDVDILSDTEEKTYILPKFWGTITDQIIIN